LNVFDVLPRRPTTDVAPIARITRFWFINEFLVYIAVLAAGVARDYFLRYRARREETIRLQAHAAKLQAQLSDARLTTLRTQLDPHFLFNTLHAVSAMVERDPRGVRRMIARLSELLRNTLEGAEEPEVPLEQELTFLKRYLEIMEIRFSGRLQVEVEASEDARNALVPNLILQPLAENAIKHGVSKIDGTGRIEIRAERSGNQLVLRVRDNGPGLGGQSAGEGIGLRNTRERLTQLYGAEQSAILREAEGGGVIAEVIIPYHTRTDLSGMPAARAGGYAQ
jgi:LytS/YehU family sensor histidine kinase